MLKIIWGYQTWVKWSGINIYCKEKEFYNYFWSKYTGKYTMVGYGSFAEAYTLINEEKKIKKYEKFVEDMNKNGFYI